MEKVPLTFSIKRAEPGPHYEVMDPPEEGEEYGRIRTYFETHPNGNRKLRRYRRRHHPFFTKSRHKGREWAIRVAAQSMLSGDTPAES